MSGKNKNEKPDWQKIRAEYLAKRTPYKILAEKYKLRKFDLFFLKLYFIKKRLILKFKKLKSKINK